MMGFEPKTVDQSADGGEDCPFSVGGELPRRRKAQRRDNLKDLDLVQVTEELLARLEAGESYPTDEEVYQANLLQERLASTLDVHQNRFSQRRYYDLIRPILALVPRSRIQGATIVDLGCGSLTPYVYPFLYLMIGAQRAYAIDIDPIQDVPRAVKALATCAGWMLLDSKRILDPDFVPAEEVLANLHGFDLPKLAAGDPAGIAADRLMFRNDSVFDLDLGDGEASLVLSVSFLEHLAQIEDALESLRRVTRVGGYGHHLIDFSDHRIYVGQVSSPFEFLKLDTENELVDSCNRLRCSQFCALFEKHGFVVEKVETAREATLAPGEQTQFVEPYRSMSRDDLERICARILVRRQN